MKPHPKLRKTIKWGGAAVMVLLVAAWVVSLWWTVSCSARSGLYSGSLYAGALVVTCSQVNEPTPPSSVWLVEPREEPGPLVWWFGRAHGGANGEWYEIIFVPLWVLIACVLLPTAFAWRFDFLARRRARLNLCPRCNYDRAGIAKNAKCPECGMTGEAARYP